jgi:hypothetical protein
MSMWLPPFHDGAAIRVLRRHRVNPPVVVVFHVMKDALPRGPARVVEGGAKS